MPELNESRVVVLPRDPLFDLALDIEHYPEFVPGYHSARILERKDGWLRVSQEIGVGRLRLFFESTATFSRPEWIEVTAASGPFRRMVTRWRLDALEEWRTRVHLSLAYELRVGASAVLARPWLGQWRRRVLDAFARRAVQIAA